MQRGLGWKKVALLHVSDANPDGRQAWTADVDVSGPIPEERVSGHGIRRGIGWRCFQAAVPREMGPAEAQPRAERKMREEVWDAIVVGAGLGSLVAAASLLGQGLRVLVVEASPHPGGTAYTYRRRGFCFPMGPLGCANPDLVAEILRGTTGGNPPEFRRVHYQIRAFGLSAPLSLPRRDMVRRLSSLFPDEGPGIERFFRDMASIDETLTEPLASSVSGPDPGEKRPAAWLSQLASRDAASYLEGITGDWRLRRILGSAGTREPYSSLSHLAAMWYLLCETGIHYPRGGTRGLCDLLAAPLKRVTGQASGAEVAENAAGIPQGKSQGEGWLLLGRRVRRILAPEGKVAGIALDDGRVYRSPWVICNADFKRTFLHLLDPGEVPPELRRRVSEAAQTSSNLQVCLGIRARDADLSAFLEGSRIIYRRGDGRTPPAEGIDWKKQVIDPRDLSGEEMEITLLSADDPSLAPDGGAVLVLRVRADYAHFLPFRPSPGKRKPGYEAYKKSLGMGLVDEASRLIPGLTDSVEVMDVATPLTFEERCGRSEGAVAGWSWKYADTRGGQAVLELVRTPVSGLLMAGYQAFNMLALGGIPSAMLSGWRAARYVLEGAGPVEDMPIP